MPAPQPKPSTLPGHYAGVPLGGIGTGCIELGQDARFRNVTINNNRTAATRIPFADGAFIAIRAGVAREWSTMILQPETSVAFDAAGVKPRHVRPDELAWYGLYPASNYRLNSEAFPLEVQWSALAPVIPYDTEASTLPLMISVLQFTNPSEEMYSVSGMFNWENLRGCTAESWPEQRGAIERITFTDHDETLHAGVPAQQDINAPPPLSTGLAYALDEPCRSNADGNYCLVALPEEGSRIALASWNKDNPEEVAAIWNSFDERGTLPDRFSADPAANCGAVSVSINMAPRETRRFVFLLTWYCPVYQAYGENLGNAYASEYRSALEVVAYGLRHAKYFQKAVGNWQQRMLQSTLPQWYTRMLLNNCHVLSTNTLLTREGEFAMIESPREPKTGVLDRSFYSSFGTLLFYPSLAEKELERFAPPEESETEPGRLYRDFGAATIRKPSLATQSDELMDVYPKFILMAYRNFHLTGKMVHLMNLYPTLRRVVEYVLKHDSDQDGVPEVSGECTTFLGMKASGMNSYVGGLWVAALHAMRNLAEHVKRPREARQFERLAQRAQRAFEARMWSDEAACYRWDTAPGDDSEENAPVDWRHSAQLAGAWYADFLHLEGPFAHRRIVDALKTIAAANERPAGVALCSRAGDVQVEDGEEDGAPRYGDSAWPNLTVAYYACPQITHESADRGFDTLKTIYQGMHVRRKRGFNQSLMWDPIQDDAVGPLQDRHMSALSIWHTLFALEGFWLSVPERRLVIAPRLPEGVNHLAAPLFTPVAFGWLTYHVQNTPAYRQRLTVNFDSPVFIETIELAMPRKVTLPSVALLINEDPAPTQQKILSSSPLNRLVITLDEPLQVQHPIEITVE